jgi:DHA2 family methylenomycin A resistance protein-like MFS transporter
VPARRTITTITTSLGFLLVQLDVSIVNVALASIGTNIHTGVSGLQWVVDSYALTFAALLLSAGAIGDRIGARRAFIAGLVLFSAASVGCALAPNAAALIAARAVQGAGASTLVPCSLALLNHACREDAVARVRAVSLWTAAGSIGLAIGPVLGGALVTAFGSRSIFLVNLPAGGAIGVALFGALMVVSITGIADAFIAATLMLAAAAAGCIGGGRCAVLPGVVRQTDH